jgi:hypothetical protein
MRYLVEGVLNKRFNFCKFPNTDIGYFGPGEFPLLIYMNGSDTSALACLQIEQVVTYHYRVIGIGLPVIE